MSAQNFMQALQNAFNCFTKPICLLSPFAFPAHIGSGLIYFYFLSASQINDLMAHWVLSLLRILCPTDQHFLNVSLFSTDQNAAQNAVRLKKELQNIPSTFAAKPTLLLRVITPSGFSVVIRAVVDSGCTSSDIYPELANLLLSNCASTRYIWPEKVELFCGFTQRFRSLVGVKLQSVEDESITVNVGSIEINESFPFEIEYTPVDLLAAKMASFGLPMFEKPLLNTKWSDDEPNSKYRVDMIIGQDLMDDLILMHPRQPTYHITPSLAVVRTKMGLTINGNFDVDQFSNLTLSEAQIIKMKKKLELKKPKLLKKNVTFSNHLQFATILRMNFRLYYKEVIKCFHFKDFFCSLVLSLHFIFIIPCALLSAFFLQSIMTISLVRHFSPRLHGYLLTGYSAYLQCILKVSHSTFVGHINFLISSIFQLLAALFGFIMGPQLMNLDVSPVLPLTVSYGSRTKTVNAFLDSGSDFSILSFQLKEELMIKNCFKEKAEKVKLKISKPGGNNRLFTAQFWMIDLKPSIFSQKFDHFLDPVFEQKISRHLNVPLFSEPDKSQIDLLIGTDIMASVLMPKTHSPRCISVIPKLNAIETRLGYYLQGYRRNNCAHFYSWIFNCLKFTDWKPLAFCLIFDLLWFFAYLSLWC